VPHPIYVILVHMLPFAAYMREDYFYISMPFIFWLGIGLNEFVSNSNNGLMPVKVGLGVSRERIESTGRHCVMTEHTKYRWLCDIIPYQWGGVPRVASVGDILIAGSIMLAFIYIFSFVGKGLH